MALRHSRIRWVTLGHLHRVPAQLLGYPKQIPPHPAQPLAPYLAESLVPKPAQVPGAEWMEAVVVSVQLAAVPQATGSVPVAVNLATPVNTWPLTNVTLIGDYLTTKGQAAEQDLQMISDLGLKIDR